MYKLLLCLITAVWILGAGPLPVFADNPHLQQALELDRQGFIAESIPEWEQFLQTRPDQPLAVYAQIKMSIAHSRIGNFGQALKMARAAAASHPEHYDAQFNLANMLSATHHYAEAVQAYQKAGALRPEEGLAFVGEGLSLFGDQKLAEAVQVLRKVRKLFKDQKNIGWYQHVRIMIGQMKGFEMYPPDFSELWRTNNLKKVRETYENSVFPVFEKQLNL